MTAHITIGSKIIVPEELKKLLLLEVMQEADVSLEVRRYRAMDVEVLVAIVGAAGTGLGALLAGLLKVAVQKRSSHIVIQGSSGRRVELPADSTPEVFERCVQLCHDLDVKRIDL